MEIQPSLEGEGAKLNAAATPTALIGAGEVAAMCVGARERVDGYGARAECSDAEFAGPVWGRNE